MKKFIRLTNLNPKEFDIYSLKDFAPRIIDNGYLKRMKVNITPAKETLRGLYTGSELFIRRISEKRLFPELQTSIEEIDIESDLEIHNYTGACPTLTYEISPVKGCNVGCLYCLVSDGVHDNMPVSYGNYDQLVARVLDDKRDGEHYFYFSAKTEAFQESTLQTGIAHKILMEFIKHYQRYPQSKARLFIASKAGKSQLLYQYKGDSIINLLKELKGKAQFNTSLSIMPDILRSYIEPYSSSLDERLEAVLLCQDNGVMSNSALVQPIFIPYLNEDILHSFFGKLQKANIINFKPEFLTLCMENLAMLGQILGYFDKDMERELYECYISCDNINHKKQRDRLAPSKKLSRDNLSKLIGFGKLYGLSASICYWVRKELEISEEEIPTINSNGFQCLGYQTRLF